MLKDTIAMILPFHLVRVNHTGKASFMESETKDKYKKLLVWTIPIVLIDQATKMLVLKHLQLYQTVKIIPGLFNLTHVHNPGGAFGFMAGQSQEIRSFLFLAVSTLAIGFVFYFYHRTPRNYPWLSTGLALIFSGAIGNMIDRIHMGKVIDFLDFYVHNLHWPAFNVADSAISIGMAIFIFHILFKKMPE